MRFSPDSFITRRLSGKELPPVPLTRREFFRVAEACRAHALEYARFDQHRVNLAQCHAYNSWQGELRNYAELRPVLSAMGPARPIARWQVLILAVVLGLMAFLGLPTIFGQETSVGLIYSYVFFLLILMILPERLYGTTIEQLEGKVLRIVDALDSMLLTDEMDFSEAAFHQAKDNLSAARIELRQQIDLAHR